MSRWDNVCPACGKHRIWEHDIAGSKACRKEMERRRKVKWPRRPKPNPLVNVTLDTRPQPQIMTIAQARQKMGQSKGGIATQARGCSTRFTSATGKAARARQERKRWWKGRRVGRTKNIAPAVPRAPLRALYATAPRDGIQYHPDPPDVPAPHWTTYKLPGYWTLTDAHGTRVIGERFALMRLGHLQRSYRQSTGVPVTLRPFPRGKRRA